MGELEVVPVHGRKELNEFLEFPYRLYHRHPFWVPPLRIAQRELFDRKKHPFYANATAEFLLARRQGRTVGRLAAILDRNFNRFHGEDAGFFGFFECEDDPPAASALFHASREWLHARGARIIRGPVNPSTNYECGLLIDGFDSLPMIMMPYNPPYYAQLVEGAGLRKAKDLYAYTVTADTVTGEKTERVAARALEANAIRVRPISMEHFQDDVERVWGVYNGSWMRNWGFVPMTREEFVHTSREMKQILKPDLVLLGEVGDRVVGFALALPDINPALKQAKGRLFPLGWLKILYYGRLSTRVRVLALGVLKEYRTAGVAAAFYAALMRNGRRLGFRECEMSWVLEDNVLMNRSLKALGAKLSKTYRLYQWN
ncbi:MAG: N-acetyltransferase [Bryobacteraceae bacterium]